ncbi:sigma-54 dependent transcriptional regulator [Desulfobotulus sp.]|jgi:DNA-binding NtrC family response regulator|uniref:sigma-54-dependent transcriptional regulator n=1 Tax=Desulfobotulus sp. TaxID=1940337 RepID=UPI002A370169|nr:sigma-54 dependent transcriptional regulator [Desulfobotulus sp.]MDY0161660.1 sigma-54 dependent transcriptional regulator [Desulfobotulus sp.]
MNPAILVVEDELHSRNACRLILRKAGFDTVHLLDHGDAVLPFLAEHPVSCVLLDLSLPGTDGESLLPRIIAEFPEIPVLILTGAHFVETAVRCMQKGAFDFMTKPVERERLLVGVRKALEIKDIADTSRRMAAPAGCSLRQAPSFAPIQTRSPAMIRIFHYMEAVAPSSLPVLITGETGTGKELVARVLHTLSGRKGPFVGLNIAGLDETLLSDTLFGHEKGAFTQADRPRKGLVAEAAQGTLFLDEIGDMPPMTQVKLLRFLQEGEYLPIGADRPQRSTARILAATNRDPASMRAGQGFRKDLFFRIAPHAIHLPPLRERKEDFSLLLSHFTTLAAKTMGLPLPRIAPQLAEALYAHPFSGNVREFQGMVFDAVSRCHDGLLTPALFSLERHNVKKEETSEKTHPQACEKAPDFPTLAESEALHIAEALRIEGGNQTRAALLLGISRQTLNRKLRQDPRLRMSG